MALIDKSFLRAYHNLVRASPARDHRHPPEEQRALVVRIRKVAGQLHSIERMVVDDRDCAEILTQVVSARRALKSLSEKLIQRHIHHCIENARDQADARKKLRALLTVLERYVE